MVVAASLRDQSLGQLQRLPSLHKSRRARRRLCPLCQSLWKKARQAKSQHKLQRLQLHRCLQSRRHQGLRSHPSQPPQWLRQVLQAIRWKPRQSQALLQVLLGHLRHRLLHQTRLTSPTMLALHLRLQQLHLRRLHRSLWTHHALLPLKSRARRGHSAAASRRPSQRQRCSQCQLRRPQHRPSLHRLHCLPLQGCLAAQCRQPHQWLPWMLLLPRYHRREPHQCPLHPNMTNVTLMPVFGCSLHAPLCKSNSLLSRSAQASRQWLRAAPRPKL